MDVAQILVIGRRWWWLVALGVLFSVAAYGIAVQLRGDQARPTYEAATTLFVTLPPLPQSALAADSAKQPWELDRQMATYAQMAKSHTVADRAIHRAALPTTPGELAARVSTDTFGYTQLLRIGVSAGAPLDAQRSLDAVIAAFADVRAEQSIPGRATVFETSPPVRTDRPLPLFVNLAIVAIAGLMAAAGIVFAFERAWRSETRVTMTGGQAITGVPVPGTQERAV